MIKEEQAEETEKLIKKMKRIYSISTNGFFGGAYDKVLINIEKGEQIIKSSQGDLPEEIKRIHITWLYFRSIIYAYKGNLALSFKSANEILNVAKLYDDMRGFSYGAMALGRYYYLSGDSDKALVHMDRAIRLIEESLNKRMDFLILSLQLTTATIISADKEDMELAKKYFKRLEEIQELKPADNNINDFYRTAKAHLLKSSMRFRDRIMAEDLFRKIIKEVPQFIIKLRALSELCELLLVELRVSNDIRIIGEIKPLIEKSIGMAQHSGLYYYLIEAYIIHGKLVLIMFDIEGSRRYFTQARRMVVGYGFMGLADEIADLHEAMMENLDMWEQLEKINAPLSERMELARLDDHLRGKFRTRMMKMERITEGEVTVYKGSQTCLVCKGRAEGNIYICPTCNSIYCKGCTQAVIDLENQCWSCNSPIDASKPVKPYKPVKEVGDTKESKKSK